MEGTLPYDSNGNASLVPSYKAVSGDLIRVEQHNPPLEDIVAMLSQVVLRSGVAPMSGPLNLNGFRLTGLDDGEAPGDAVNKSQLDSKPDISTFGTAAFLDVGNKANTVAAGNDARLSNEREWTAATIGQFEAQNGIAEIRRAWTALRVAQAIAAQVPRVTAALNAGAVGTYALLSSKTANTTDIAVGATYEGSALEWAGLYATSSYGGGVNSGNVGSPPSPNGTWRALFRAGHTSASIFKFGLFLRIS